MATQQSILLKAVALFARHGFAGVSMRDVAGAVEVSVSTVYHHFPSKEDLYISAFKEAFADKADQWANAQEIEGSPKEKLTLFVGRFTHMMYADQEFRTLLQRELMDDNPARLKVLAEEVFAPQFQQMSALARDIAPDRDPHMLAISMAALVMYHLDTAPIRKFLGGWVPKHDHPDEIAQHVVSLLLEGVG